MSYPGNPSLASDTRDRILSTYRQTLDLAGDGRVQEAALGCDFILKMDPQFAPAGALQSRLEGASGAIEVSDLVEESQAWSVDDNGSQPPPAPVEPPAEMPVETESPVAAALAAPDELLAPELSGAAATNDGSDTNTFSLDSGGDQPASEEPRIQELLDEGEAAFDRGDYQAAIDSWSRIFLIDIDHDLANSRIEEARKLKAEGERQVEELYNQALDAVDNGDTAGAKALLEQVLSLQPGHLGAKEYLEELDRPQSAAPPPPPGAPVPPQATPGPPPIDTGLPDIDDELPPFDEPDTVSPPPPAQKPQGRRGVDRSLLLIGVGVLGIVLAGAWFLLSNWGNLFPNSDEPVVAGRPPADPIRDANRIYLDGDVDGAIAKLEGVPQISEHYDRAQALLARWREEAETAATDEGSVADAGTTAASSSADRERRIEVARRAYDGGRYLEAAREFQAAARMAPLDGAAADLFEDAKRQLLPIRQQIALFRDREWRRGLSALWRIHLEDPSNYDAMRLLRDSYYNLGVQELQRASPRNAIEHLKEIPELDPTDEAGARVLKFASAYEGGGQDLLYRIFVENLEFRK